MTDYRAKLEAAAYIAVAEVELNALADRIGATDVKQIPVADLERIVLNSLGFPEGTVLTDEQWMVALTAATSASPATGELPAAPSRTPPTPGALEGLSEAPRR
jgi:hypothetical protein